MSEPQIKRGPLRSTIGIEVDELMVSLLINAETTWNNVPIAQFVLGGGFDGQRMSVDRFYSAAWTQPACGSLNLFTGRVADVELTATEVKLMLKSDIELLNIKLPRNVYQAQCVWTVYGPGCNLNSANFTVSANVSSGSTRTLINSGLAQASGYFNLGTVQFTSGAMTGVKRTVKSFDGGEIVPSFPLPMVPEAGDEFEIKPGCDRRQVTCNTTFNNVQNIRLYPYIPTPEATI